mmetsp:Transcript_21118/g.29593  ORF Transcript_21118/g.29593 Transcript_21118/m.29593 type:complete len:307 (+) Transcript_21118:80-1000(+)
MSITSGGKIQYLSKMIRHEPQPASAHPVKSALKKECGTNTPTQTGIINGISNNNIVAKATAQSTSPSINPDTNPNPIVSFSFNGKVTYASSAHSAKASSIGTATSMDMDDDYGNKIGTNKCTDTTMSVESSFPACNSSSLDTSLGKKKKKKALTWDEHAIEEHDLLRGTRMKIDEPNTPYTHYDIDSDGDSSAHSARQPKTPPQGVIGEGPNGNLAMNWDHIENKLGAFAAARDAYPSSPSTSSFDGSETETSSKEYRRKKIKDLQFKNHRKSHYNEMEALRKWRAEHADEEDNESENEEENGNNN